jgi:hypothetical protein
MSVGSCSDGIGTSREVLLAHDSHRKLSEHLPEGEIIDDQESVGFF